jgi:DNA helicase-2/ATP-dependent DNA helicase PcrA
MSAGTTVNNSDLLASLNPQQAQAVSLQWGPALVIAGAGSGKTTVLTRRIAYLISQLDQPADSILAVTFTNKAAAEMKHRIEGLVGSDCARRLTIGTFHSVCARILRREIDEYVTPEGWRWTNNFVIYDETDSLSLVKSCISKLKLDDKFFIPKTVRHEISSLKNDGKSCSQYANEAKIYKEQKISEIFTAYQGELARNNALDFDDLILVFTELLKQNQSVLARQRRRFRHVLVDEFQDTNKSQYDLVNLLACGSADSTAFAPAAPAQIASVGEPVKVETLSLFQTMTDDVGASLEQNAADADKKFADPGLEAGWLERSLMVVGDVDQSIYSWRKADFRIILGFQKDFRSCKLIKLEENYRSTSTILDVANSIITNNTERIEKVLRCNRGKGSKAQCYAAQDDIDESYYVVEEMKRLQARGRKLSECLVLYRTNSQSRSIEEVLVRNHMPYMMVGSVKFYDRQEIKDVIAYLKLIYNGKDGIAFNRVINVPRRGVGKTSLERLQSYAEDQDISMLEAAAQADRVNDLPPKAVSGLKEFAMLVTLWQRAAKTAGSEKENSESKQISVSQLLQRVLKETRYLEKLEEDEKDELSETRVENVQEFLRVAEEFDEIADEPDLDSFLTRISLVSDLDAVKLDQDAVKLMTVHAAKGLEFAVVFVMGLEEGLFPHIRSLDSPSAMEEERRLMYVAVTRAADLLYLTLARKRRMLNKGGFSTAYTIPSKFLQEISPGLLAGYYPQQQDVPQPKQYEFADPAMSWNNDYNERNSMSGKNGDFGNNNNAATGSGARNSYYGRSGFGQGGSSRDPRTDGANAAPARPRAMRPGDTAGNGNVISSSPSRNRQENIRVQIDARPPSPADNSFEHFTVGDTVQHAKFGTGKVVQVIGDNEKEIYNIEFDEAGKRLLDPRFAKLVRIS